MDPQVFIEIELGQLASRVDGYKSRGWRLVNVCCSSVEGRTELLYTFSAGEALENLRLLVDSDEKIPAISPLYPNAFFFENEARDLYGIEFEGGILDYGGRFYSPSVPTPMNPSSLQAGEYLATHPGAADGSPVAASASVAATSSAGTIPKRASDTASLTTPAEASAIASGSNGGDPAPDAAPVAAAPAPLPAAGNEIDRGAAGPSTTVAEEASHG